MYGFYTVNRYFDSDVVIPIPKGSKIEIEKIIIENLLQYSVGIEIFCSVGKVSSFSIPASGVYTKVFSPRDCFEHSPVVILCTHPRREVFCSVHLYELPLEDEEEECKEKGVWKSGWLL